MDVHDGLERRVVGGDAPGVGALAAAVSLGAVGRGEVHCVARAREEERHGKIRHRRAVRVRRHLVARLVLAAAQRAFLGPRVERETAMVDASEALAEPEEVLVRPEGERERRLVPVRIAGAERGGQRDLRALELHRHRDDSLVRPQLESRARRRALDEARGAGMGPGLLVGHEGVPARDDLHVVDAVVPRRARAAVGVRRAAGERAQDDAAACVEDRELEGLEGDSHRGFAAVKLEGRILGVVRAARAREERRQQERQEGEGTAGHPGSPTPRAPGPQLGFADSANTLESVASDAAHRCLAARGDFG